MARQRHNAAFITGSILGGVGGAAAALWRAPRSGSELRALLAERLGATGGSSAVAPASAPAGVRDETPTGLTTSAPVETGESAGAGSSNVSRAWNATRPTRASVARVSKASQESLASARSKGWDIWNARSSPETRSFGGRALSFVENATAPIVGVKLGQSARNADTHATETVSPGTASDDRAMAASTSHAPVAPGAPVTPVASETVASSTATVEPAGAAAPVSSVAPVQRERVVSVSSPTPPVAPVAPDESVATESTGDVADSGIGHVASTEELVTPVIPDERTDTTDETGTGSEPGSGSFTRFPDFDDHKRSQ